MPIDRICFDAVIVVLNYDSLSKTFMVICRVLPTSSNNSPGFEGDHIVANLTAYINSSVPRCPVVPAVTKITGICIHVVADYLRALRRPRAMTIRVQVDYRILMRVSVQAHILRLQDATHSHQYLIR